MRIAPYARLDNMLGFLRSSHMLEKAENIHMDCPAILD